MKSGMAKVERVPLGSVVQIERGIVEPSGITLVDHCVSLEDLDADSGIVRMNASRDLPKSSKFRFSPNHVLYGKLRPYLRKVVRPDISGVCSTDILPILPGIRLDRDYLFHFLRTPGFTAKATAASVGVNLPRLSPATLSTFDISLPPLPEQRRIAEVLDRAEELRAKRRAALAQLGSLTQILFFDLFGDPTTNPKGLIRGTLGEVATFVGGGTPSRARPEFYSGSICWATSKDMKCEFLDDTQEHITSEAIEQSATNLVPPGTILVVVKSKILAHSLPVAIARVPTCFGQDLKGIRVSEHCNVTFVATALRCGKRWLLERARGLNTEGLTLDHLKTFPLLLPSIDLQHEFARRVAAVEKLKAAQSASLAELDALFASLQSRAFKGEL